MTESGCGHTETSLLRVTDLKVHFVLPGRYPFRPGGHVHAVDGVSFIIPRRRTFGIVGESGSGKTTTALAVMQLVKATGGTVAFEGEDLAGLGAAALRRARCGFQMIFQDPFSSLNPRLTAGAVVREPLDLATIGTPAERNERVAELFRLVGLLPEQQSLYPHQFSGGQRQRIGIARALSTQPKLIVCDEPVSALDVAIQAQILNLLVKLQDEFGLSYLFISHDLRVVQYLCDEIGVMYLGRIVETTSRAALFQRPLHPYTWALLSAVPGAGLGRAGRVRLSGDPPSPINLPNGCRFSGRCPFVQDRCRREEPQLRPIRGGGTVACHLVSDDGVAPHHGNEPIADRIRDLGAPSEPDAAAFNSF